MLNTKKLFTKILTRFASTVTGPETVTFPFTATKSGLCIAAVTPPSGGASYVYVSEDGNIHEKSSSAGGTSYTLIFPVIKGKVYAITAAANYAFTGNVRIYPIMGGVVKKLLAAAHSGRGWACA